MLTHVKIFKKGSVPFNKIRYKYLVRARRHLNIWAVICFNHLLTRWNKRRKSISTLPLTGTELWLELFCHNAVFYRCEQKRHNSSLILSFWIWWPVLVWRDQALMSILGLQSAHGHCSEKGKESYGSGVECSWNVSFSMRYIFWCKSSETDRSKQPTRD